LRGCGNGSRHGRPWNSGDDRIWSRRIRIASREMAPATRRARGESDGGGAPHSQCAFSMMDGEERYLVVRLTALGDILHTVPAVAALRSAHKKARIDWVVERKWAPVLE